MSASPLLDHMVVNVRVDMDRAADQFAGLGFKLTPRGYHSLGSINHLMILDTDYVELIGIPAKGGVQRKEIAEGAIGFNGLVFKTEDVNATFAHLQSVDMAGEPPRSFTRPVEIDGTEQDASFSTVAVRPGVFAAGRVYFCQHHTPELVWHKPWRAHSNGAQSTSEFLVVAKHSAAEASRYATLLGLAVDRSADGSPGIDLNGARLTVLGEAAYQRRFGQLALELGDRDSIFGAISLRCNTPADAAKAAKANGGAYKWHVDGRSLLVSIPAFSTVLEFRA
jgi:hypothetical protein